jgi:hypothetical protein
MRKVQETPDECVHFYVQVPQVEPQELTRLRDTFLQFPGPSAVLLHLVSTEGETVIELPDRLRVAAGDGLLEELERAFGPRISVAPYES